MFSDPGVRVNTNNIASFLGGLTGVLADASARTQNRLAYEIMQAERQSIALDLASPTPWSVRSIRYSKLRLGTGRGLSSSPAANDRAAVFFNTPFGSQPGLGPTEWLGVQIKGGESAGPKRSELALMSMGYLKPGEVWVPAVGAPKDRYGNITGAQISAMLSALRNVGPVQGGSGAPKFIPIGEPGNWDGVWRLVRGQYVPFIWFIPRAQYRKRWGFYETADAEINAKADPYLRQYIDRALQSQR